MPEAVLETKSTQLFVKVEPSFKRRVKRVADARFGENESLLVRRAIERLIEPIEAELNAPNEPEAA